MSVRFRFLLHALLFCLVLSACDDKQNKAGSAKEKQARLDGYRKDLIRQSEQTEELRQKIAQLETELKTEIGVQAPVHVTTFRLDTSALHHEIEVRGSVRSDKNVTLSTNFGGQVIDMLAEVGDRVQAGALLVKLDTKLLEASLREVENELSLSKLLYERQKALWEKEIGTEIDFLQAENRYESLLRRRQTLIAQIAQGRLRAPFAGRIEESFIRKGELAAPSTPLLRLLKPEDVYVHAELPQSYFGEIRNGSPVRIKTLDGASSAQARVIHVSRVLNAQNQTFSVRIRAENKQLSLNPNQLLVLYIEDYTNPEALLLPSRLVQRGRKGNYVFCVEDAEANGDKQLVARRFIVQTGVSYKGKTEILSGLNIGDRIIDEGASQLSDGDIIRESAQAVLSPQE